MPNALSYRARQVRFVAKPIGVYALCDLDETPIYVGQSEDGIQNRVRRHLTSARSDVIANRQIDVWEIAYVWSWTVHDKTELNELESLLFHRFNDLKTLMNGSVPVRVTSLGFPEPVRECVQIMEDAEIQIRRDPSLRLPRQIEQLGRLVDHILNVKDSSQLRLSLVAHFERLTDYYSKFLEMTPPE
jgi:hypothetical protein